MQTTAVKLDDTKKKRLQKIAVSQERTVHWLIKKAVDEFLEREEFKKQELAEDLARWNSYQISGHAIPHEQAQKWLKKLATGKKEKCPQ